MTSVAAICGVQLTIFVLAAGIGWVERFDAPLHGPMSCKSMTRENGGVPPISILMPMVELKSNPAMLSQDMIGVETSTAAPRGGYGAKQCLSSNELNAHAVDFSPPHLARPQPVVRELQMEGVRCGKRVLDLDHRTGIGQVSDSTIEDRMSVIEYDLGTKKRPLSRRCSAFR